MGESSGAAAATAAPSHHAISLPSQDHHRPLSSRPLSSTPSMPAGGRSSGRSRQLGEEHLTPCDQGWCQSRGQASPPSALHCTHPSRSWPCQSGPHCQPCLHLGGGQAWALALTHLGALHLHALGPRPNPPAGQPTRPSASPQDPSTANTAPTRLSGHSRGAAARRSRPPPPGRSIGSC